MDWVGSSLGFAPMYQIETISALLLGQDDFQLGSRTIGLTVGLKTIVPKSQVQQIFFRAGRREHGWPIWTEFVHQKMGDQTEGNIVGGCGKNRRGMSFDH